MRSIEHPVQDLSNALAHACFEGFPVIEYETRDWEAYSKTKTEALIKRTRRPSTYDTEVVGMFPQMWGSTALGFGGVGGAAMTTAYTIILKCGRHFAVYFGGRHAYTVESPSPAFFEDAKNQRMAACSQVVKYIGHDAFETPQLNLQNSRSED